MAPLRRVRLTAPLAVAALLGMAGLALAAGFVSGTYRGSVHGERITITLKLRGGSLRAARISGIPIYCAGGGPATPVSFPGAKLTRSGHFTVRAVHRIAAGPLKGRVGEQLTLSGRFTGKGTAGGTLNTFYPNAPAPCSGSSRFSAKR